jgi:nicotinamide mononucleotide adenylyltransferase
MDIPMTRYRHALVIGKFYPPHRGHHMLIRQAATEAARVTVLVMGSSFDSIPTAARMAWLRAEHTVDVTVSVTGVRCDAPVDLYDDDVWAAQVGVMRAAARGVTAEPVDAVASGERYGDELARRLGAHHLHVDRLADPISATLIRSDIAGHWDKLAAPVRAGLTTRVVVLGAASTGTTTLARDLTDHYRSTGDVWRRTELVDGDAAEMSAEPAPLLLRDCNRIPAAPHDLYLLTADLAARTAATTSLENALTAAGYSWFPVSGAPEHRRRIAAASIDALIARRLTLTPPVRGPGFEPTDLG